MTLGNNYRFFNNIMLLLLLLNSGCCENRFDYLKLEEEAGSEPQVVREVFERAVSNVYVVQSSLDLFAHKFLNVFVVVVVVVLRHLANDIGDVIYICG
jgi:hypothetical protein